MKEIRAGEYFSIGFELGKKELLDNIFQLFNLRNFVHLCRHYDCGNIYLTCYFGRVC